MLIPLPKVHWSALLIPHSWACLVSMDAWVSVKGSNLPGQADTSMESLQNWLVRLGINAATFFDMWSWILPEVKPFGHKKVFVPKGSTTSWLSTIPSTLIGLFVILTTLWNKLSKIEVLDYYRLVEKCTQAASWDIMNILKWYFKIFVIVHARPLFANPFTRTQIHTDTDTHPHTHTQTQTHTYT